MIWEMIWPKDTLRKMRQKRYDSPYDGLYGEAPTERGILFKAWAMWKDRDFTIWSVWKGGEILFSVCKRAQNGLKMHFVVGKKLEKSPGFVIYSYLRTVVHLYFKSRDEKL